MRNNILYVALTLNPVESERLLENIKGDIEEGWKIYCHHMTIAFHKSLTDELYNWCKEHEGEEYEMTVTHIGISDKALAFAVDTEVPCANKRKHITIAVNTKENGKPVDSNFITLWQGVDNAVKVKGRITFYYKN